MRIGFTITGNRVCVLVYIPESGKTREEWHPIPRTVSDAERLLGDPREGPDPKHA